MSSDASRLVDKQKVVSDFAASPLIGEPHYDAQLRRRLYDKLTAHRRNNVVPVELKELKRAHDTLAHRLNRRNDGRILSTSTTNKFPSSGRWETRFARLVRKYGVAKLAHNLEVDPTAIYQWVRGSVSPRPDKAMLIVMLLQPVGRLRLEDIYRHRLTVQANARLA